ncbi:MAG: alpha/beta hydrolase family protein [Alphaproteobacteria bacterium]
MTLSARNSRRRAILAGLAVAAALVLSISAHADEPTPGPQGAPKGNLREQLHLIPAGRTQAGAPWLIAANLYRPQGEGPFPLVVINHGSPGPKDLSSYPQATRWFVERGFAVALPTRRGYGRSAGGRAPDDLQSCKRDPRPDYAKAGLATADDIQITLDYMRALADVKKDGAIVVGQSAGGWGSLALSSRNPPGVAAIVNFAGGRLGHENCDLPGEIAAAGRFGETARVPTLWIYTENDSFFPPGESRAFHDAYVKAGGVAEYHLLPAFAEDGHTLFARGTPLWTPLVEAFLKARNALPAPAK